MLKIGLTGGIGSGKSTVASMLEEYKYTIIDADTVSREVLNKYSEILEKVRIQFGDNFFDWRGEFRRREFGNHVFRFPKERKKYESIIMPFIIKEINEKFEQLEKKGEHIVILDAPTLIENNLHEEMDMVILVWVDQSTQIQRIKSRDKLSQNEIINRINAQMSLDRKKDYANFIIDNGKNLIKTKEQIDDLVELLRLYEK
ncbi:dephospho-CoA kinase [Clostridium cavendishii DSM 21758]|uniref:Dephospho-CoA kinase n=1 Tax=Clostridium cavendishii DSM 21758 TaxID=1121302 RepID=A0A1M6NRZ6_9CLOT|nr:dephospho-CoA kinase [Clostridium cavendishii]SHJ98489.1 dephospho-CoA kinase [Clostridium cavendishii DSM 21758]